MNKIKIITLATLSCVIFSSCLKSSFYVSGHNTFANVKDANTLIADGISTYHIVENASTSDFKDSHRLFINCDLQNWNDDSSFDVKLNDFVEVQEYDAVDKMHSTISSKDDIDFQFFVNQLVSGNEDGVIYINLWIQIPSIKGSDVEHRIELVYEPDSDVQNTFKFYLYHDAAGDVWTDDVPEDQREIKAFWASFHIEDLYKDLEWEWNSSSKVEVYAASSKDQK